MTRSWICAGTLYKSILANLVGMYMPYTHHLVIANAEILSYGAVSWSDQKPYKLIHSFVSHELQLSKRLLSWTYVSKN